MGPMPEPTIEHEPILIGGGEVGRCPTRIHYRRFFADERETDPVVERRIADGRRWEATVMASLLDGSGAATMATPTDPFERTAPVTIAPVVEPNDREIITARLLDAGVPLIVGGRLSAAALGAVGVPDLLLRLDDGYAPVDVKHHRVIGRSGIPARVTPIKRLADTGGSPLPFRSARVTDLLQVAHYWVLLDRFGHANRRHLAGIIGSDSGPTCAWVDLAGGRPSILDRYQIAFDMATDVVATGRVQPDRPLVPAVWRGECRGCPWADVCRAELESIDHVSLLPAVPADDTERLLAAGITTTAHVARLTSDDTPPEMDNATEAILQARARGAGRLLARTGADMTLPDRRVEIDFDVETYRGALYLAGLLVGGPDAAEYRPISNWTGSPEGEGRVITELFEVFDDLAERDDFIIYHWTGYERKILEEASARHGVALRSAPSVNAWFDRHACDLWAWIKQRFVSPNGYSLKVIAPLCGFNWRDDDPGGAQSELWYLDLLAGDLSQRSRLLEYNEDDVAAQRAIRHWVRSHSASA